jgi:hypothetical protein
MPIALSNPISSFEGKLGTDLNGNNGCSLLIGPFSMTHETLTAKNIVDMSADLFEFYDLVKYTKDFGVNLDGKSFLRISPSTNGPIGRATPPIETLQK